MIRDNASVGVGMMADRKSVQDFRGAPVGEQIVLVNNTIVSNRYGVTGGDRLILVNNVVADNEVGLKRVRGSSAAGHNLYFGNGTDFEDAIVGNDDAVFADPRLDDDAVPAADSAAIDAGTSRFSSGSTVIVDYGPSDYHGPAPDIGAYEVSGPDPDPDPGAEFVGRIIRGSDDAEEGVNTGEVDLTSSDLEMVNDIGTRNDDQLVGIRFDDVIIAAGSTITGAFLQFTTDEKDSRSTSLQVRGEASSDAGTFTTAPRNISSRPLTRAAVTWAPQSWNETGEAGRVQRSVDLSPVIQEIVNQSGWQLGNSIALIITGSGRRVADSHNGDRNTAPTIHISHRPQSDPENPDVTVRQLFGSGFESGVVVADPEVRGQGWWASIRGSDQDHDWADDLPERKPSRFQFLVGQDKPIDSYAMTRIETMPGHDGSPTRALAMRVSKDDPDHNAATSRNQFNLLVDPGTKEMYFSYWLKFQPDLEKLMPNDGQFYWKNFVEWRESGATKADYRIELLINRGEMVHPSGKTDLFWGLRGEQKDNHIVKPGLEWYYKNEDIPVIIGEWFKLEVFYRLSEGVDGRVLVKVNGEELFDHTGITRKDSDLQLLNIFKLYTSNKSLAVAPARQWIDDVEMWSGIPGLVGVG